MHKGTIILWLAFLFAAIITLFWRNEYVYSLPTPVPENYRDVQTGAAIVLPGTVKTGDNNPVFLHFFNPACPCSKFNIPHFRSLVKQYGDKVNFMIVPLSNEKYSVKNIQEKFDLDIPVLSDTSLAALCGVYSTPQAVIIEAGHKLYYRGNYNKSRYCTDKKSEYARIALEALFRKDPYMSFDRFALKAYGCQLPKCTDNGK
ncbi:MAG: hypothetical protein SFU87_19550 [Chitinophagaceae bacterium]|nr:hypothetical protein [Chitinophagaceae bacterium]